MNRASLDRAIPGRPDAARRDPEGFYRTPRWVTEALLEREEFSGPVLEPACGDGAISEVLIAHGYRVLSSDLVDRGYGQTPIDFLTAPCPTVPSIITNPPFHARLPEKFALRAVELATSKVALLLRTLWLESARRREMIFQGRTPLRRVYVLSERANVARSDHQLSQGNGRGGMASFSWYVWERGYRGPVTLDWV